MNYCFFSKKNRYLGTGKSVNLQLFFCFRPNVEFTLSKNCWYGNLHVRNDEKSVHVHLFTLKIAKVFQLDFVIRF